SPTTRRRSPTAPRCASTSRRSARGRCSTPRGGSRWGSGSATRSPATRAPTSACGSTSGRACSRSSAAGERSRHGEEARLADLAVRVDGGHAAVALAGLARRARGQEELERRVGELAVALLRGIHGVELDGLKVGGGGDLRGERAAGGADGDFEVAAGVEG